MAPWNGPNNNKCNIIEGIHGLVCKQAPSRIDRHQAIARAISSSGIHVTKEPVGLIRLDGKRPDSLTLIPWHGDKRGM